MRDMIVRKGQSQDYDDKAPCFYARVDDKTYTKKHIFVTSSLLLAKKHQCMVCLLTIYTLPWVQFKNTE